jgi:hypothetical protein
MTQTKFAEWLGWKQTRISEVESGRRVFPTSLVGKIVQAEDLLDSIAEALYEAGLVQVEAGAAVAVIPSYGSDAALWADWPEYAGLPAATHRVAAVEAHRMLADEGHVSRIVDTSAAPDLGRCPGCGSTETTANTWEAWCMNCDRHWTKSDAPGIWGEIRAVELVRRRSSVPPKLARGVTARNGAMGSLHAE